MSFNFEKKRSRFSWIQTANASSACPTLATNAGAGCTQVNAQTVDLSYNSCSFGNSAATWSGVLQIADATNVTCGTFPNTTLTRQFVTSTSDSTPSSGVRTGSDLTITVDHATPNLGNYQGDTIAPTIGAGYGIGVNWAGAPAIRVAMIINQHVSSPVFDHSVTGTLGISETNGASNRMVSGQVVVYHNLVKVKATSTFSNVVYTDVCCLPTDGSISTAFAATSQSGATGQALDGKSETLTFTGCGTATLTQINGKTIDVTLSHCL
jgi:hypothetical protein